MDKKLAAVFAAAVIVAAGSIVALNSEASSSSLGSYPDSYLTVLGNADLDLDIDADDASAIQGLIDNDAVSSDSYNYDDYYMYDANNDGTIDSADIDKVNAIVDSLESGDWTAVGTVYYVNVDYEIASYDMTHNNKVITLITPVLDTVLALGGQDLVVGSDNRIITGSYRAEYESVLDIDSLYNVGSCNEPDTEIVMESSDEYGGVNVVCGTADSYGSNMEEIFEGTDVQVIRIGTWEYGSTLYGLFTLGFLLKLTDNCEDYYEWYKGVYDTVQSIVGSVDDSEKSAGGAGASVCYGYGDELSLLGVYSAEYTNLMVLDPYDSTEAFFSGASTGGHGNSVSAEDINTMVEEYGLKHLIIMIAAPFHASQDYIKGIYDTWLEKIAGDSEEAQAEFLSKCDICVAGYSFSSGVSEILNQLILCYYLYPDEFKAYFGCSSDDAAKEIIGEYVNEYCERIGIDGLWGFTSDDATHGMNLLYCGEDDARNILNGE